MCDHNNFYMDGKVARITAGDDGPVTGYHASVKIICLDCKQPFEFVGLPAGYHPALAMVSVDGTEARLPIQPQSKNG